MKLIKEAVTAGFARYAGARGAGTKPGNPFDGFRKRTITPMEFVGEVASIAAEAPTFNKVWVKRELDPRFRETLMLAVARLNDSKYCSWAHHEWARIEGVSEARLAHIEQMDRARFDPKTWLAITYACELVEARFGPVDGKLMQEMRKQYTAEEVEEITLVTKVMDAANRSSNTFDAFVSRLSGKPSPKGRIVDEAILSAAFCGVLPPLLLYFSRASKRSIDELVRRMIAYTAKMEAEYVEASQGRKQPARPRKRPAPVRKQPAKSRKQPAKSRKQPAGMRLQPAK